MRFLIGIVFLINAACVSLAANPLKTSAPEMSFQIMRASDPACEPICPEWIYAQGEIKPSTVAKFRQVLMLVGKSKLAIILTSGGGDVRSALAMGREIRRRQLTVGVGAAYPIACKTEDAFCTKDLKPKQPGRGWISNDGSYCASAYFCSGRWKTTCRCR